MAQLKLQLISQLIQLIETDIQEALAAAQAAHDGATHEQSKAETQYDTLGLEHAYLAHGQSQRIEQMQLAILKLNGLEKELAQHEQSFDEAYLGAIIELSHQDSPHNTMVLFFVPAGGGYTLTSVQPLHGPIQSLTPDAPIAKACWGLGEDDEVQLNGRHFVITKVY